MCLSFYLHFWFSYRAHGGDERGSHYLQVFATYLGRHFMTRDLCTIHEMVNQYMSTVKQVCRQNHFNFILVRNRKR